MRSLISVMSHYHTQTFALLGHPPVQSSMNEQVIRTREVASGITFPPAFREWYCFDDAIRILADYSNCDSPFPIERLGATLDWWLPYRPLEDGVLPFMRENQGVCTWAIRLDGQADPVVLVEVDSGTPPHWQRCAQHFSDWVYWLVHDRLTMERARYQAQAAPLSRQDLKILDTAFRQAGRTYAWPGKINYRFHANWGDLIIWANDDQADWFLAPYAEQSEALLAQVWPCGDLAQSLYGINDEGEHKLQQFRNKQDADAPTL
jgi:hypothetical protein